MTNNLTINIKTKFPSLVSYCRYIKYFSWINKSPQDIFTEIYQKHKWVDLYSLSGPGSDFNQTAEIRRILPQLINDRHCSSLLDIPCGDFYWMNLVDLNIDYIGADIVHEIIINNQKFYTRSNYKFVQLNIIEDDLPKVDLILCRDCLVHFSNHDINKTIKNIKKSGSKYLLTTIFNERTRNENIPTGAWHPVNLLLPPFNFPTPIVSINEKCTLENYNDKYLGLWDISDIPELR